nr:MAG TPA: hypothetical protein [Caudoviricetes sp.]
MGNIHVTSTALYLTKEVMLFVLCMTVVIIAFGANKK